MPELPEVEAYRAWADRHLTGRRIERVRVLDPRALKGLPPRRLAGVLEGRTVTRAERRGKVLLGFLHPNGAVLALRFGMTGTLALLAPQERPDAWDRVVFELSDGTRAAFRDMRLFGSVRTLDRAELGDLLWSLGPEPLEVEADWFVETLRRRRGPVKAVLLDQSFVAGVGNIYADEALHRARIRPDRRGTDLSEAEARRVWTELRRTLRVAIRATLGGRDPRLGLFMVRGRAARERRGPGLTAVGCPVCGEPLRVSTLGGRTTYWCEVCQS